MPMKMGGNLPASLVTYSSLLIFNLKRQLIHLYSLFSDHRAASTNLIAPSVKFATLGPTSSAILHYVHKISYLSL